MRDNRADDVCIDLALGMQLEVHGSQNDILVSIVVHVDFRIMINCLHTMYLNRDLIR
jgi:hypothetical protein